MIQDHTSITSKTNPHYRKWLSLATRKCREKRGAFLIEGYRTLEAALDGGAVPAALIFRNDALDSPRVKKALSDARLAGLPVYSLPPALFNALSTRETPQGIAAEMPLPPPRDWKAHRWRWVALLAENLQDPRNLGLLVRTSDAAGVDAVFLSRGSADLWHPEAVAASMGSVFHLPVYTEVDAGEIVARAKRKDAVVAATSGKSTHHVATWVRAVRPPVLLLLGNEGAGLSQQLIQAADVTVGLPLHGKAESLNVAVAAGIICYFLRSDAPPKCRGVCK